MEYIINSASLIEIIKSDNIKEFENVMITTHNTNYCIGRFPMLSLCYLYNAKKIINKYESTLIKSFSYEFVGSKFDAFLDFKKVAKRIIRLYVLNDAIISPLEMLLILNKVAKCEKLYPIAYKNNTIIDNLAKIEEIRTSKNISHTNNKISIPKPPLSFYSKLKLIITIIVLILFISLSTYSAISFFNMTKGEYSYSINNEEGFIKAIDKTNSKNLSLKLTKDLCLNDIHLDRFTGTLNGNGHTIYLTNKEATPFINSNNGIIKNITFFIENTTINLYDDFAPIIRVNNGTIENCTVDSKYTFYVKGINQANNSLYFSSFIFENRGTIKNCSTIFDTNIIGDANINSLYSSLCAVNYSIIDGCMTDNESKIIAKESDIAGLVVENSLQATISNCINNALISQVGETNMWNPNTAGLVMMNYGLIEYCENKGEIKSESKANIRNDQYATNMYTAGIVCSNYQTVVNCKNSGNLTAKTNIAYSYIGGICSINSSEQQLSTTGTVEKCENNSTFISTSTDGFIFSGGIVGYNLSYIFNCASNTTFTTNDSTKCINGSIIGIAPYSLIYYMNFGVEYLKNNTYLKNDTVQSGIGVVLYNNSLYMQEDIGITKMTDSTTYNTWKEANL